MSQSLETAKEALHKNNFPFDDLPNDRIDPLWDKIQTEFSLSLAQVSALKNAKIPVPIMSPSTSTSELSNI